MTSRGSPMIRRRALLRVGSAAAFGTLSGCSSCNGDQTTTSSSAAALARALVPDPAGVLDLPPGFSYRVLQRQGDPLSDGYRAPGLPDAMGCFAGADGSIVLMRNHELMPEHGVIGPYTPQQGPPSEAYDRNAMGGVSRLVLDPETLAIRRSNLVLAGSTRNCAGGLSPWGWLSCEEAVDPGHGYVFLCPSDAERVAPARALRGYGRFRHEAASVDPATMIAYLTEDQTDGCFYRFVPHDPGAPFAGKLQALRVKGRPAFSTAELMPGTRLPIDWVDVPEPDPLEDDSVRYQAQNAGAAIVCRGEGLWLAPDAAYFCATSGGPIGHGQIFRLTLGAQAMLDVIAASTDADQLNYPDNLCVSPHGQLYVAEDSGQGNFLRKVSLDGEVLPFARNAHSFSEFAGPCFSPDGRTLFVNMQEDQLTLAIRGPFDRPLPNEGAAGQLRSASMIGGNNGLAVLALAALAACRMRRP
jgi:secreted PhoX family phosphatase